MTVLAHNCFGPQKLTALQLTVTQDWRLLGQKPGSSDNMKSFLLKHSVGHPLNIDCLLTWYRAYWYNNTCSLDCQFCRIKLES